MTAGRLIAVVGPSGVGKDSVMEALAAADPRFRIVRRVITRSAELGGEDFEGVTEGDFASRLAQGAFCLHWQAHGLSYGIPKETLDRAEAGTDQLVNLSRSVIGEAARVFPRVIVLRLSARPETLAKRLAGRGRERLDDIKARLARPGARLPDDVTVIDISNDGALADTVSQALAALKPVGA